MINRVIIEGRIKKAPWVATIKGKEKCFMLVETIVPAYGGGEVFRIKDTFRVLLHKPWMKDRVKNVNVGELIEIVGRSSCMMHQIKYTTKEGEFKVAHFNDTTIIPSAIQIIPDTDNTPDYTDYLRTIDSTNNKKENKPFKLPEK